MKRLACGVLIVMAATSADALVCRDLFKKSIHSLESSAVERLAREVETVNDRITYLTALKHAAGQSFSIDRRDLDTLLRASARLLQSQGASVRAIRFAGLPALEIIPQATARPGWNKMAASLNSKLNARLVFAPATLAKFGADAMMGESSTGSRTILISRQSLSAGRSEYRLQEEIGHAASNAREKSDPNSFMGAIDSIDPTLRPKLTEGTNSHHDQMSHDEILRSAKNFVRVARNLERNDKSARRDLIAIARNARDVVKVTRVTIESLRAITRSMMVGAEGSGVSMAYDGTPKAKSAFVFSDSGQVFLEAVSPGVVRLDFEGSNVNVEIFVRDREGGLSGLIPRLQADDPSALKLFQARLPGVVAEWTRHQALAVEGIERSIVAVTRMRTMDDRTLAREVRAGMSTVAPLIARRRP